MSDQEEAFQNARKAASNLMSTLSKLRVTMAGDRQDGGLTAKYIPKAQGLVNEIEAFIKKAEKDLE